jgi:hypothetical protein
MPPQYYIERTDLKTGKSVRVRILPDGSASGFPNNLATYYTDDVAAKVEKNRLRKNTTDPHITYAVRD